MEISKIKYVVITLLLFICRFAAGQSSDKLIHDGNKLYEQKKFQEAEKNYRKSLETKENTVIGNYNLGNTLYQEGKTEEAKEQYQTAAANKSASADQLAKTYHNLGNSYLKSKKFEESIQSYKQALKLNPKDNDTRYNLAYAQSMLRQQQQQQNKNDQNKDSKDNKENKDKNQQQQNQDKKDQDKQKQDQQQQDQQSDEQKQADQQKAKQKDKISKEDAEKILQALNNDEKKTQKKLNVKQPVRVSIEKQW